MNDLISRQAAIDALAKFVPYAICDESTESYTNGLTDAYNLILQLPSAQPDCSDCIKHGGDWDCDHVHCHKGESAQPGFNEWCTDCKEYDQEKHCCPRFNRVIRETLDEVEEQKMMQWTPCSERLPKEIGDYLVTTHSGQIARYIYMDTDSSKKYWMRNVVAWMLLPKPWKGEKDE